MRTKPYNHTVRGPDPEQAFGVTAGVLAIVGPEYSLLWPTGMIWPGTQALPDELMTWLRPSETYLTPEARWEACVPSARDIEVAVALVQVQRVRSREELMARMDYLASFTSPDESSQVTLAALLGSTRETVTKTIWQWRARRKSK